MTLTYYLTVDGVNGGSTSEQSKGSFEISGYEFDISNVISIGGSGGGAGKPSFSPLKVALNLTSGLPSLLNKVATGQAIKSIRIEGFTQDGKSVYDLKLGNVFVTGYHDTNTGLDNLSFSYGQVALTTTPQNPNGTLGTPTTASWNVLANAPGGTVSNPVATPANASGGGNALSYYLVIDGVNGGSTSERYKGAFDLAGYSFDISNVGSLGGGAGAGKASFSPLEVALDLSSGLPALLSKVAAGQTIKSIRVGGVAQTGATVYDLKLGQVVITNYHDTNTGYDRLGLTFSQLVLTTTPQNPDGSLGTSVTTAWNVAANQSGGTVPLPVVPVAGPAVGDPLTGFDGAAYIASYSDLITAFGYNPEAGLQHYLQFGLAEGRTISFQPDDYVASYKDLIEGLGYNRPAATQHYISYGVGEGRAADLFDEVAYLNRYTDLQVALGNDFEGATQHYIQFGFQEGRTPL